MFFLFAGVFAQIPPLPYHPNCPNNITTNADFLPWLGCVFANPIRGKVPTVSQVDQNLPITTNGRCGIGLGSTTNASPHRCPPAGDFCCSDSGHCGNSINECGILRYGCRSLFGLCGGPLAHEPLDSYPQIDLTKGKAMVLECTSPGMFALTFDDGPSDYTSDLLDILDANDVKATFFVNAYNYQDITQAPFKDVIKRMYKSNHHIASHTYDHLDITLLDANGVWDQLKRMDRVLKDIIGKEPRYFRPPFGKASPDNLSQLDSWGYQVIWQNIDSLDAINGAQPSKIVELALESYQSTLRGKTPAQHSFISLQHDTLFETVYSWTPFVIKELKQRGYKFVTVGECLGETDPSQWYR
jgi:peptidoglycan/xylan/chitin deacetylase (PgdA/CDA1 family)